MGKKGGEQGGHYQGYSIVIPRRVLMTDPSTELETDIRCRKVRRESAQTFVRNVRYQTRCITL